MVFFTLLIVWCRTSLRLHLTCKLHRLWKTALSIVNKVNYLKNMIHFPSKGLIWCCLSHIWYLLIAFIYYKINQSISISVQARGIEAQKFQIQPLFHCISKGQAVYMEE